MNQNFLKSLSATLKYEGGYTNNPDDPGGPTNLGITWREYNIYRHKKGLPVQSVKYITVDEMREIYKNNYWNLLNCDSLSSGVDFSIFDLAVNNGVGRAKQFLTIANTLHPNGCPEDMVNSICDQRLAFDKRLGRLWRVFGAGWSKRIADVRQQSLRLAKNAETIN
jgi:lysozyme family protein